MLIEMAGSRRSPTVRGFSARKWRACSHLETIADVRPQPPLPLALDAGTSDYALFYVERRLTECPLIVGAIVAQSIGRDGSQCHGAVAQNWNLELMRECG
jgi:hypothetical protein